MNLERYETTESLKAALAAAQAEVAGADRKIASLKAQVGSGVAEIAALRWVLAGVVERCVRGTGGHVGQDGQYLKEIRAALSASSAAEPLLADILAAVEAMDAHVEQRIIARDAREKSRTAANKLRRWVP